jgi:ribose-phosphate pyrophosphokinase
VFVVQPTCTPVDEHLVELLIMIDAFRRSSAARITAVIPYYGYARQDRKDKPRVPISAKLVANILSAAGANRVLTMDLHKAQIQGFFDIPVDHLFAAPVIIDYLARQRLPDITIVAPDAGGAERARAYAKRLGAELAVVDKRRSHETGAAEVMNVIGDVEGRTCILQDDIVDTAGTLQKAATALMANGASRVLACAVHGVLSAPALERIEQSPIEKMIVTNTIRLDDKRSRCQKLVVLSVARLLAQAIRSIHEESSVSSLFV